MSCEDIAAESQDRGFPTWVAPVMGALATLSLGGYLALFGKGGMALYISLYIVMITAALKFIGYMNAVDRPVADGIAPNARVTIVLLVLCLFLFWIPVIGIGLISYTLYRARWLQISDWWLLPFSFLFFFSAGITLIFGIIFAIDE